MQVPFEEGVPYLSRLEEKQVMEKVVERNERSSDLAAMDIPESDTDSLEFLRTARQAIDAWLSEGEVCPLVFLWVSIEKLMNLSTDSKRISEYPSAG
jgi:hypothetical protein